MVLLEYPNAVRRIVDHLETSQMGNIQKAAEIVAEAIAGGGIAYCSEIGHANQHDFLNRAGGLAAVQGFSYSFSTNAPHPTCQTDARKPGDRQDLEVVRFAVEHSPMKRGDVMLLGSVSGKNRVPVEMAMACRDKGLKVIGFTSLAYTAQVESLHPSGKKLCDVCDVVIDNGAPYGDASVPIDGWDRNCCPVSGVACIVAGWMLWESVIRILHARGQDPTVFMSVNRAGGMDQYQKDVANYNERGF